uniref:Putative trypsin-like peptidase domain containing protein n=1 Tax=viral metagenome TaxID=1070528 RepID=A0A6M3J7S0_9ZZZZ
MDKSNPEKTSLTLCISLFAVMLSAVIGMYFFDLLNFSSESSSKYRPPNTILESSSEYRLPNAIVQTIGSVVHVINNTMEWQGSGVAVTEDMIMTARHVVEGGLEFTITLNDGQEVLAVKAISSKKYDLGFIKLEEPILTPANFGSIIDCRLGQAVYVIGSPYGKLNFNSVTLGIISGLDRNCDDYFNQYGDDYGWSVTFTTDSAGHPGNSGCPVFTMDGIVRGILVGGDSNVLVYCVPVNLVIEDMDLIRQMFLQDEYEFEEYKEKDIPVYNHSFESRTN